MNTHHYCVEDNAKMYDTVFEVSINYHHYIKLLKCVGIYEKY